MMLPSFAADTITIVEPVLVDDRGTTVADWTQPPASETEVTGCSVQPGASSEALGGRQGVTVRWTVYAPLSAPVTAHSGVLWHGTLYQVDGEPARWASPTGALGHLVIVLIDQEG